MSSSAAGEMAEVARDDRTAGPLIEYHHALIYVSNVGASVNFYKKLGFEVIQIDENHAQLSVAGGNGTIVLRKADGNAPSLPCGPPKSLKTWGVRLYFETSRLDDLHDELEQRGVQFVAPPALMPWGSRHAFLRDPDDNEISLFEAGRQSSASARCTRR